MKDQLTGDLFTGEFPDLKEQADKRDWRGMFREMSRLYYAGLMDDLGEYMYRVSVIKCVGLESIEGWFKCAQSAKWFDSKMPSHLQSKAWEDVCVKELKEL